MRSLSPLSGHYRPAPSQFRSFLKSLQDTGVDLSGIAITRSYAILVGLEAYSNYKKGKKKIKSVSKKVVDKATPSSHGHGHGGKGEKKSGGIVSGEEQAMGEGETQCQADAYKPPDELHGPREDDKLVERLLHGVSRVPLNMALEHT